MLDFEAIHPRCYRINRISACFSQIFEPLMSKTRSTPPLCSWRVGQIFRHLWRDYSRMTWYKGDSSVSVVFTCFLLRQHFLTNLTIGFNEGPSMRTCNMRFTLKSAIALLEAFETVTFSVFVRCSENSWSAHAARMCEFHFAIRKSA